MKSPRVNERNKSLQKRLIDNHSQLAHNHPMNLHEAKFHQLLRVKDVFLPEDEKVVLAQLGISNGELIEKIHQAPLGDPLSVRIGQQLFALRKEICEKIQVECL